MMASSEQQKLRALFDSIDKDFDDRLSLIELQTYLEEQGISDSSESFDKAQSLLKAMDADHDGSVGWPEFSGAALKGGLLSALSGDAPTATSSRTVTSVTTTSSSGGMDRTSMMERTAALEQGNNVGTSGLADQIAKLEAAIRERDAEINRLRMEHDSNVRSLRDQLESRSKELREAKASGGGSASSSGLLAEIEGLEGELDAAKAERDAVEKAKRALEAELHKFRQDKAEEISEAVDAAHRQAQEDSANLHRRIADLEEELNRSDADHVSEMNRLTDRIAELERTKAKQMEFSSTTTTHVEETIEELKRKHSQELEGLKRRHSQALEQTRRSSVDTSGLNEQLRLKSSELLALDQRNAALEDELAQLRREKSQRGMSESEAVADAQRRLRTMQSTVDRVEQERQANVERFEQDLKAAYEQYEVSNKARLELKEENARLLQQLKALQDQSAHAPVVPDLSGEVARLQQHIRDQELAIHTLSVERETIQERAPPPEPVQLDVTTTHEYQDLLDLNKDMNDQLVEVSALKQRYFHERNRLQADLDAMHDRLEEYKRRETLLETMERTVVRPEPIVHVVESKTDTRGTEMAALLGLISEMRKEMSTKTVVKETKEVKQEQPMMPAIRYQNSQPQLVAVPSQRRLVRLVPVQQQQQQQQQPAQQQMMMRQVVQQPSQGQLFAHTQAGTGSRMVLVPAGMQQQGIQQQQQQQLFRPAQHPQQQQQQQFVRVHRTFQADGRVAQAGGDFEERGNGHVYRHHHREHHVHKHN
eukprot:m.84442 g.84442  ORF g.84442 m.84442 type:complete len:765 (-) comp14686_c0_seq1:66-2360(-)